LEVLASNVDRMLQEAVRTLAAKLKELGGSQGDNLLEARSQICLREQIELLEQFQTELGDGKVVAHWLNRQRSQHLAQSIGQYALNAHPQILETASSRSLEAFYFSIEQFLEQLSHCLTWGRTNSIDNSTTPIVLADEIYVATFGHLRNIIPTHLPDSGIKQLEEFIDYLVQSLPNHRHLSID
jgi:molybdopterin converting factor small subunit